jgi:hypothetical protein
MGLRLFGSSCGCGDSSTPEVVYVDRPVTVKKTVVQQVALPNPDPEQFEILRTHVEKRFVVVEIRYIGCTNYEGRKILLFEDETLEAITSSKQLDPHFCDNPHCISPIARFEPTDAGWQMAVVNAKFFATTY